MNKTLLPNWYTLLILSYCPRCSSLYSSELYIVILLQIYTLIVKTAYTKSIDSNRDIDTTLKSTATYCILYRIHENINIIFLHELQLYCCVYSGTHAANVQFPQSVTRSDYIVYNNTRVQHSRNLRMTIVAVYNSAHFIFFNTLTKYV